MNFLTFGSGFGPFLEGDPAPVIKKISNPHHLYNVHTERLNWKQKGEDIRIDNASLQ